MRALAGTGFGALYGGAAGIASSVVLAIGFSLLALAEDVDPVGEAIAVALIFMLFGSMVGVFVGSLGGALLGAILGAAERETKAPWVAALAGSSVVVVFFLVLVAADGFEGSDGTDVVLAGVLAVVLTVCFGVVGYAAGTAFSKTMLRRLPSLVATDKGRPIRSAPHLHD